MNRYRHKLWLLLIFFISLAQSSVLAQSDQAPHISIGNGSQNWITVEGVTREGGTLTFSEVQIDGDGWLIIHPFEGGAPNGDKYVASKFLEDGKISNVQIQVHKGLSSGEMFIVMLHRDSNENKGTSPRRGREMPPRYRLRFLSMTSQKPSGRGRLRVSHPSR